MKLRAPLPEPPKSIPFTDRPLREVLEQRTERAIETVRSLDIEAWHDDDPAPTIALNYDVALPTVDWGALRVQIGATSDQRMRAVLSWQTIGDEALLRYSPDGHLLGRPPVDAGVSGRTVIASVVGHTLSAADIDRAAADTRRYLDNNLAFVVEQVSGWRESHRRRVRDAGTARRELLESVDQLAAVTA